MKRRNFIKSVVVGAGALSLPFVSAREKRLTGQLYCKSVNGRVELCYLAERTEMQITHNGEITFNAISNI